MASKVICISGASAGIGAATALRLAKDGHSLVLGARRTDRLEALAAECLKVGAKKVFTFSLDVTSQESVDRFYDKTMHAVSKIDVLINNAGLAIGTDHVKDGSLEEWQTVLDTNVTGALRLTRKFLPSMYEKNSGHLVFLSSIAAHQVYEGGGVYAATKHAIKALAQTLKLELVTTKIRVSTIDPGMVETDFSKVRFKGDEQKASSVYKGIRPLNGEDIAYCIAFTVNAPEHLNVDQMIVTPVGQATVYKVHRS